jgi:hypothetical protein
MTSTPEAVEEKIMVSPARREASDFNAKIIEDADMLMAQAYRLPDAATGGLV